MSAVKMGSDELRWLRDEIQHADSTVPFSIRTTAALLNHIAFLDNILADIRMQATRHQRATDEQEYLITDLEIIEKKVDEAS